MLRALKRLGNSVVIIFVEFSSFTLGINWPGGNCGWSVLVAKLGILSCSITPLIAGGEAYIAKKDIILAT